MKCKKHGEGPAYLVTCDHCGATYRIYKKTREGIEQLECRNCGAPLKDEQLTTDHVAEKACAGCGELFCDDCVVEVRGHYYCEDCGSELIKRYRQELKEKERRDAQRAREAAARAREQERYNAQIARAAIRGVSRGARKGGCGCALALSAVFAIAVILIGLLLT